MPLVRLDQEEEKVVEQQKIEKKVTQKNSKKNKKINKNLYPILYILIAIAVFGLGLLTIALINLAVGRGFII